MTPETRTVTLRIEPDQFEALERNRVSYGTPYSEQVRRALDVWLRAGGLTADGPPPVPIDPVVVRSFDRAIRDWEKADLGSDPFIDRLREFRARMQPPDTDETTPDLEADRKRVRGRKRTTHDKAHR